MRAALAGVAGVLALLAQLGPARAWMHSGAYGTESGGGGSWSAQGDRGGSASGGGGSWSADSWRGGTASGGGGSWSAKSEQGGTASGGEGSWNATNRYGMDASGGYDKPTTVTSGTGTYTAYPANSYNGIYHPPTTVNYYGCSCGNCGGWSGGAVAAAGALGAATGAAIGASSEAKATAAGAAAVAPAGVYTTLPANCQYEAVAGGNYYNCGGTWMAAAYGANELYYKVVPPP